MRDLRARAEARGADAIMMVYTVTVDDLTASHIERAAAGLGLTPATYLVYLVDEARAGRPPLDAVPQPRRAPR